MHPNISQWNPRNGFTHTLQSGLSAFLLLAVLCNVSKSHIPCNIRIAMMSLIWRLLCGGLLKWWYPTTMVFLLKMFILGCEMGVPPFKETPMLLHMLHKTLNQVKPMTCPDEFEHRGQGQASLPKNHSFMGETNETRRKKQYGIFKQLNNYLAAIISGFVFAIFGCEHWENHSFRLLMAAP